MLTEDDKKSVESEKEHEVVLQSPFLWKYVTTKTDIITILEGKLDTLDEDNELLQLWSKFVLNLALCHEYFKAKEFKNSASALNECEAVVLYAKNNHSKDKNICVMDKGLELIISNCWYHVEGSRDSVESDKKETLQHKTLTRENQASVWGVRAAVAMEYGRDGIYDSIFYSKEALKLDSNCGEWNFLLGKALSRKRRVDRKLEYKEELEFLTKAVGITGSLAAVELLAQSYNEYCKYSGAHTDSCLWCEKSATLFRNALDAGKDKAHVNARCARGFLTLPRGFQDLDLAKQCVLRSLKLSPDNVMCNHTAGLYYRKVNEYQMAKKYLMKAAEGGAYNAELQLINMKIIENKRYDATADLESLLEKYPIKQHVAMTLAELGIYVYCVHKNYKKAEHYWKRMINENPENDMFKSFYSLVCPSKDFFNIYEIMQTLSRRTNTYTSRHRKNYTYTSRRTSTEGNWRVR